MTTSLLPTLNSPSEPPMRMTGGRRAVLLFGVLGSLTLMAGGAVGVVNELAGQYETTTRTLPALGNRLTVHSSSGDVRVTVGAGHEVRVTSRLEWSFRKPDVGIVAGVDGVAIRDRCRDNWNCATSHDIAVPRGFAVDVQGSAGALSVHGTTGAVRLHTSGGRVTATDVAGVLDLHSSAGAVRGENLRSSVVQADSSGGRVQLGFSTQPMTVSARSRAGSVSVTVPPGSGPYRVDADSNAASTRVEVRADPSATPRITARSRGGTVRVSEG